MADFISKLQYKICEKGEFFDEQPRSLEETLALIKAFPWDQQRGTDIQLSGPGIVIAGPNGDCLKVALYFNGKFSAYYLDNENHLYEYHTDDLNEEYQQVRAFFSGNLNLEGFDKHFFNIGNRVHFMTQSFEYTAINLRTKLSLVIVLALCVILTIVLLTIKDLSVIIISMLFIIIITCVTLYSFLKYGTIYIKISKGHDEFIFGKDKQHICTYNKQDVKEMIIYENRSRGRGIPLDTYINQIVFNDGKVLLIPNIIMSSLRLRSKFTEDKVHIIWTGGWMWNN